MIHSLITAMQQPWYVFSAIFMFGWLIAFVWDDKEITDHGWWNVVTLMLILAICWPITAGFLLGSLAQRWLK
jgi:hypothetical protein